MRTLPLLVAAALALAFVFFVPAAHAGSVGACTDIVQPQCEGIYCIDRDGDGRFQWNECEPRYCTCDPQPEPW